MGGVKQCLGAQRFGPIGRICGRRLRLVADDVAPDAAHEPEAVAADMDERGLMDLRRATPAPRRRDNIGAGHLKKLPPSIAGASALG